MPFQDIISLLWTILKVFIEFDTIFFLFYALVFFGHDACGILAPWPGIKPTTPVLEGKVLTTGPPGKSRWAFIYIALLSLSFFSLHFLFWLIYVFSVFLKYVKFVLKKTSRQAIFFFFFWCWDVFISRAHGHTNLWMSSVKTEISIWVHLCYDTELEKEEHLLCLKIYQFRGSWIWWAS